MKNNQKGFGAVEALLFLILVSILGFTGYYVYHTRNNTNATYSNSANSSSSTPTTATSSKFVFKEIGIQIELPNSLNDLTYTTQQVEAPGGGTETAIYLSSKQFQADVEKCYNQGPQASGVSFGAIGRTTGKYPTNPTPENADGTLLKQFDGFYISGSLPNGITTCTNKAVVEDLAVTDSRVLFNKFAEAFKQTATLVQ